MTLSFFASRDLATSFHEEGPARAASLEEFAESLLRGFPEALADYAGVGRTMLGGQPEAAPDPAKPVAKVGRNSPCPCGSGKKFKKCCGATSTASRRSRSSNQSE